MILWTDVLILEIKIHLYLSTTKDNLYEQATTIILFANKNEDISKILLYILK